MNLKAIKPSYGDFGRVSRGVVLKDISKALAEKLISSGAYVEATPEDLKASETVEAGSAKPRAKGKQPRSPADRQSGLRQDGPTIAEYVSAGYRASNYPPDGYASRSTDEEIAAAIKAQKEAIEAEGAAARAELDRKSVV